MPGNCFATATTLANRSACFLSGGNLIGTGSFFTIRSSLFAQDMQWIKNRLASAKAKQRLIAFQMFSVASQRSVISILTCLIPSDFVTVARRAPVDAHRRGCRGGHSCLRDRQIHRPCHRWREIWLYHARLGNNISDLRP